MAGKRIGVGPRGGTSATYFPEFFNTLKVPATFVFGEWADLAAQVHARTIDVLAVGAGVPFPSFIELEAKNKVRYVALSPENIAALRLAMPELTPSRVPAGTYPSLLRALSDARALQLRGRACRPAERSRLQHRARACSRSTRR